MNDRQGDRGRRDGFSHEDRALLNNVHLDVHGIRRDFRDAIEKSQTALLNRLSLIGAKIDAIGTGGLSPEDKAALADLVTEGERITRKVEALNAER